MVVEIEGKPFDAVGWGMAEAKIGKNGPGFFPGRERMAGEENRPARTKGR